MAKISIYDLHNTQRKEFITNLTPMDLVYIFGGEYNHAPQILNYGVKALEFVFAIYAIDTILLLTKSFKNK